MSTHQVQPSPNEDDQPPTLLDLALGQGPPAELDALRQQLGADPLRAVEFAETRQLLERMRGLRIEPGPSFAPRLERVVRHSERSQQWRRASPRLWPRVLAIAGMAAAVFAVLSVCDPLRLRRGADGAPVARPALVAATGDDVAAPTAPRSATAAIARTWDASRRLLPDSQLVVAFDRYHQRGDGSPDVRMSEWLSPRNALAVLRLDHELRRSAAARQEALRARGHLAAVDGRVQRLAAGLAATLLDDDAAVGVGDLALSIRALLAAGDDHGAAIARGAARLQAQLPELSAGPLALALDALGELAAATGTDLDAVLHWHGRRLVDEVVEIGGESWSRRLPELLSWSTPATEVAAAGRFLRIAPAFGVDPGEALLVRLLLAARLQDRRVPRSETPDVPVALVYGFGDLLAADERDELERRLRTWRPTALLPDFEVLQQLAATREPCCTGYARWQLDLRGLCAVPTPTGLAGRAALCLCLSAAFGRADSTLAHQQFQG